MSAPNYEPLFYWVRERESIRVKKEVECIPAEHGKPTPWSDDWIFAGRMVEGEYEPGFRFCNVRREDDRGTVWIHDCIRAPFADHPMLWLMLCIGRQINWPDTLHELVIAGAWPGAEGFEPSRITSVLNARKARGDKVYTGAYMISAPATKGADKQSYIAETVIGGLWDRRGLISSWFKSSPNLQGTHERIMRTNGWGPFMAYQAVVDMRFTALLNGADDIARWAAAGPGTLRGLNRIHGREVTAVLSQGQALTEMRALYKVVQAETGVQMDFSDVPNILCETDKYLRVKNGEGKPRALYVHGRGS